MSKMCRRRFLKRSAGAVLGVMTPGLIQWGCGSNGGEKSVSDVVADSGFIPDTFMRGDQAEEIVRRAGSTIYASLGQRVKDFYGMGVEAAQNLGITGTNLAGSTVFIKPNFVTLGLEIFGCQFDPSIGECTKPELVIAVAEQCLEAGAAKVIIGEGAQKESWEWDVLKFNEGTVIGGATNLQAGADWLKSKYGENRLELLCLNQVNDWKALPSASEHENMKDGIFVARAFAEADHVISMPVMKTHTFAMMTASMKNYVGVISSHIHGNDISRCWAHLAYKDTVAYGVDGCGISGAFVDIHKYRRDEGFQDFSILDATICLEGTGPHTAPVNDGITIHTKLRNEAQAYSVLASDDLVAMDATAMRIMGLKESEVKAIQMARYLELGEVDEVNLSGANLNELLIKDWVKPVTEGEDYFEFVCGA